jgi:hypothetical protein
MEKPGRVPLSTRCNRQAGFDRAGEPFDGLGSIQAHPYNATRRRIRGDRGGYSLAGWYLSRSVFHGSNYRLGGWVSTRASGQFSSRWGSIEDLVLAFTVVLPGGEIVPIKPVPRAAEGPDLRHLFIGSEGTMGVIVDVTLKIFPFP